MRKLGTEKHDQPASQPAAVFLHTAHLNGSIYFFYSLVDFCWIIRDFTLPGYSRVHIPSTARWLRSTTIPSNAQEPRELGGPSSRVNETIYISPRVISLGKSVQLVSSDPHSLTLLSPSSCSISRDFYEPPPLGCCVPKLTRIQTIHIMVLL